MKTQRAMKTIEPEIKKIKAEIKSTEAQSRALMELYKKHGINPLSGLVAMFVQLPLLFALFSVFRTEIIAQSEWAYSFIAVPSDINTIFLGISLSQTSKIIAAIAAISQFIQAKLAVPAKSNNQGSEKNQDFAAMFQKQAVFLFPIIVFVFSMQLPAAVSLYWTALNIFAIVHEAIVRRHAKEITVSS